MSRTAQERIRQVISERHDALEAAEAARRQAQEAAAQLEAMQRQIADYEAQVTQARTEAELYRAGLTDEEGARVARVVYEALPADARPPLGEWLANRDSLPRGVRTYLGEAAPAPQSSPDRGVVPTGARPDAELDFERMTTPEYRAWRAVNPK